MSDNQIKYIKNIKKEKYTVRLVQLFLVITFITGWELLSRYNVINSFIYSSPSKIIETIKNLYLQGNLFTHIGITLFETIIAFLIGLILGFIIALLLYQFKLLSKICEPFLIMLNSLPKVALGPLIIIIVGADIKSVIFMALLINLIVNITTIYNGFINTDETRLKLLESFKANKYQLIKYIVIPSSYTTIISSLKLNISMSLIGVIMGEFLVSKAGIGYLIIYGTQVFNLSLVMTGIIFLAIISFLLYKIVYYIELKLIYNN